MLRKSASTGMLWNSASKGCLMLRFAQKEMGSTQTYVFLMFIR